MSSHSEHRQDAVPGHSNRREAGMHTLHVPILSLYRLGHEERNKRSRGIRWTLSSLLSDLDFADDICLLAHRNTDMQATASMLGLKFSTKKIKHMRINHRSDVPIILHGEIMEEVKQFTYLGSKMTTDWDTESEINARLFKAGQPFASVKNIRKSQQEDQLKNQTPLLQE